MHRHGIHGGHFVLLLPLHPPILEPDLDLPLRQAQSMCNFDATTPCQVAIKVEFLLQFQRLVTGIWRSLPFCLTVLIYRVCKQKESNELHFFGDFFMISIYSSCVWRVNDDESGRLERNCCFWYVGSLLGCKKLILYSSQRNRSLKYEFLARFLKKSMVEHSLGQVLSPVPTSNFSMLIQ